MMIDREKLRDRLNKKLDMALEVAKVREEVLYDRNLEEDENYSLREIEFAKKVVLYECANYMDELNKK